jgi:hypothetical protein
VIEGTELTRYHREVFIILFCPLNFIFEIQKSLQERLLCRRRYLCKKQTIDFSLSLAMDADQSGDRKKPAASTPRSSDRIPVASQKELEIIRECLFEARWFRSVPMASVAAASVFYLVRKGSAAKKSCSELE